MRVRLTLGAALIGAAVASGVGCDGGTGEPGPTGMQVSAGRDFGNLFFWKGTLAFTRQATIPNGPAQDLWVWPDGEASPLLALPQIDWSPPVWWADIIVGNFLMTGSNGELIYDLNTRAAIDLGRLSSSAPEAFSAPVDYAAIRRDGGAIIAYRAVDRTLLVGGEAGFTPIVPFSADGADFMGSDLVVLGRLGAYGEGLDGIYRVTLPSGEVSPLPVPAFDGLSTGANSTAPRCGSFGTSPCRLFRVLGCGANDAPCAETGRPPCFLLYERGNSAELHPYAFNVDTGEELALPGIDPSDFTLSPDRHRVAWTHSYLDDKASGGAVSTDETNVYFRDFCTGAGGQCSLPSPNRLGWRRDGALLTVDTADQWLGLVSVPEGRCGLLTDDGVISAQVGSHLFAPDGQRLAWHSLDRLNGGLSGGNDGLWIGDADGANPRLVAQGAIRFFSFAPDGQAIFISRSTNGPLSLGWLPISGAPPVEQALADGYDGSIAAGNRRVLLTDRWNDQDASGTLTLIDLLDGSRQVIARAVTDFTVNHSIDGETRLVYAVRGRFASGQDGLWQTTLPAP